MKVNLSVIILTKNEENNIVDCTESVSFADEIIIIDDFSEDRTVEIVENLKNNKIRIYRHGLGDDFSIQRNFGLEIAKGEWVLFVDADERVTEKLKSEIKHLTIDNDRGQQLNGYFIKRRDFMWKKKLKYGETGNIKLLRLAKRNAEQWVGKVHEVWKIKGKVGELNNAILHYPHLTITEFLKDINFYTDLKAKELLDKNVKAYWWSILIYPLGKFVFNYGIRRGFLDGIEGFIFAVTMSFHSFLVRGKLWLLSKKS